MKKYLVIAFVIFLCQGCIRTVEIPAGYRGVKTYPELSAEVLKPGKHLVPEGTEVRIFDLSPVNVDENFDFRFSDMSKVNLRIAFELTPIADSLSAFYSMYQSNSIEVVTAEMFSTARQVLLAHKPTDLTRVEFENEIREAIMMEQRVMNYVKIEKFDILELSY